MGPSAAFPTPCLSEVVLTPALELRGITKRYGPVVACDQVDLSLHQGQIHGLLGENGAGKSSLMKILMGLERADAGTIRRGGDEIRVNSPQAARRHGFDMVHQHFSLVGPLTVWENVILGDTGPVRRSAACEQISGVAQRYGLPIDPLARVEQLSAGERQRVELIKCLRRDPQVLVLDEPTSVLTRRESEELFAVLRQLVRAEKRAVILISHKLAEITAATDVITVLRGGKVVFHEETANSSREELARQMVGRQVSLEWSPAALGMTPDVPSSAHDSNGTSPNSTHARSRSRGIGPGLQLESITLDVNGSTALSSLSLEVAPGEIVGLYGVEGNGQSALGDVLSGLSIPHQGTIRVGGAPVNLARSDALTRAGLGIIPEDRHRCGLTLGLSIAENLAIKSLDRASGRLLLRRRSMTENARRLMADYDIVAPSPDTPVERLSGGNQQRVVLARELDNDIQVLVAAQPTQGLDIGAIEDMYERLRGAAAKGIAVLLISTELEEIMVLSSRVAVISSGRIAGVLPADEVTPEKLGLLIGASAQ